MNYSQMSGLNAAIQLPQFKDCQDGTISRLRNEGRKKYWWRHVPSGKELRKALSGLSWYIATPRVSKHRVFTWLPTGVLPDCQV
jgi:hypothetical protein